jgi:heat shock protein HslJ
MRSDIYIILLCSLLFSPLTTAADDPGMLVGSWSVFEIGGMPVLEESGPTLTFADEGGLSATAGCNQMSSSFEGGDVELKIGMIAATRMMCPEPLMSQEVELMKALEAAREFIIEGDELVLLDEDNVRLLSATIKNEP